MLQVPPQAVARLPSQERLLEWVGRVQELQQTRGSAQLETRVVIAMVQACRPLWSSHQQLGCKVM